MAFDVRLTTAQGLVIAELAAKLDGAKRAQNLLGINGHETRVLWNAARRIAAALPKTPASRRRSRRTSWRGGVVLFLNGGPSLIRRRLTP